MATAAATALAPFITRPVEQALPMSNSHRSLPHLASNFSSGPPSAGTNQPRKQLQHQASSSISSSTRIFVYSSAYGGHPLLPVGNTFRQVHMHRRTCKAYNNDVSVSAPSNTEWFQKVIELQPYRRGCHIITEKIYHAVPEIKAFEIGFANLFVMHTSASLTINENASPDVPLDMEDALNKIVPEGHHYRHLDEGFDDMPAHVKSSMMGCSLTVPIKAGRLSLGIWQGIWLNEHRNYGGPRRICITIQGLKRSDGRTYM